VQFSDQPVIYNQFLEIMKSFKSQRSVTVLRAWRVQRSRGAQSWCRAFFPFSPVLHSFTCCPCMAFGSLGGTLSPRPPAQHMLRYVCVSCVAVLLRNVPVCSIDTPGVIHRVSELFKGHNNLILGFNAFLPSGYKIEVVTDYTATPPVPYGSYMHGAAPPRLSPPPTRPPVRSPVRPSPPHAAMPAPPRSDHAPPEFSHAIDYVTKIKKRFASEPSVYKRFLEILHTYQRQQRSIKDVLDQVRARFWRFLGSLNLTAAYPPSRERRDLPTCCSASAHRCFDGI
jgi:hypothetical protein